MKETMLAMIVLVSTAVTPIAGTVGDLISPLGDNRVIAVNTMDLVTRWPSEYTNEVFADNILLALHLLKGDISKNRNIDWNLVRRSFEVTFVLKPGEMFAFHSNKSDGFQNPTVTMNSRFYVDEGYRTVGGLGGNGVCHLASLINWTASKAGLEIISPTNHDFAPVNGIPQQYGVAINSNKSYENLQVKNILDYPIMFIFQYKDNILNLSIIKI